MALILALCTCVCSSVFRQKLSQKCQVNLTGTLSMRAKRKRAPRPPPRPRTPRPRTPKSVGKSQTPTKLSAHFAKSTSQKDNLFHFFENREGAKRAEYKWPLLSREFGENLAPYFFGAILGFSAILGYSAILGFRQFWAFWQF